METTRANNKILVWLILAAFLTCGWLLLRNGQHAELRHNEAPALRSVINDSARARNGNSYRSGLSLYYSELHGTLLILLRSGDGKAGGWVIKITEATLEGVQPLGHRTYERTCFVADEVYWSAVIARDKYMPLVMAVSIPALVGPLAAALAIVVAKLRKDGHKDLADRIEQDIRP